MSASIWLIPREGAPFTKEVQELITSTVPDNYTALLKERNSFIPHVTVTSGIDPKKTWEASGQSPQEWFDSLSLPEFKKEHDEVILELDHLEAGEKFYKTIYIDINENDNLKKLTARIRREAVLVPSGGNADDAEKTAQEWAKKDFSPHMSLMYADIPQAEIKKRIPLIELQLGFSLGSLFACCGGTLSQGGDMVLVDTSKPISEWKPIALRETPWAMWKMTHNLC